MKHIVFTVTNDLSYDQRMQRICSALTDAGFQCTLIGRKRRTSVPLKNLSFKQIRLNCFFDKGKAFYIEYNIRLFFKLLTTSADIHCGIDLDTAIPSYFTARLKGRPFVYDAHEYFSELEEVVTRPFVHFVWQKVEAFIMRNYNAAYTISEGYSRLFKERYNAELSVVRNVPVLRNDPTAETKPIVIYQGALNVGRGLEQSILAMKHIGSLELHIYGDGPIKQDLEDLIAREDLNEQVKLLGSLSPDELRTKTREAFVGLTLFSDTGLHHQHSLANRFFDYMHAGIPQVTSRHAEYERFNEKHEVSVLVEEALPENIASAVKSLQSDPALRERLCSNAKEAAKAHNWQEESKQLIEIYRSL